MGQVLKNVALTFTVALILAICVGIFASAEPIYGATITDPLDFTLDSDEVGYPGITGDGWTWDASSKTLTLDEIDIDCGSGDAAIKLPDDSKIVLVDGSKNLVGNSDVNGITCEGDLEIKGAGSLTINADIIGVRVVGDLLIDGLSNLNITSVGSSGIRVGKGISCDVGSDGSLLITNCTTIDIVSSGNSIRAIGAVSIDGVDKLTTYSSKSVGIRAGPNKDDLDSVVLGNVSILNSIEISITSMSSAIRTYGNVTFDTVDIVNLVSVNASGIRTGPDSKGVFDDIAEANVNILNCGTFIINSFYSGIRSIGNTYIEEVEELTINSEASNGIRCGADNDLNMVTSEGGDLNIIDCGDIVTEGGSNAIAVYGDMTVSNVESLIMTGEYKGIKTWGTASFVDCDNVVVKSLWDDEISEDSSYQGFGITSGEGVLIENTNLEAYGARYGIVTGYCCDYNESIPTGGDIVIKKSKVDASCAEYGYAAIFAGDDDSFNAKIILKDSEVIKSVNGYVVDVDIPDPIIADEGKTCQTITDILGLTTLTSWAQASKDVEIWAQYDMTYNANGAEGTLKDASSPYLTGSKVTVLGNIFTKDGYEFVGFNTRADGTGTAYLVGDTVEISSDMTLYPVFKTAESPLTGDVATGYVLIIGMLALISMLIVSKKESNN